MGASTLSIAITGLNAAQAGLLTTSHNISNSNTAGYSRQVVQHGKAQSRADKEFKDVTFRMAVDVR